MAHEPMTLDEIRTGRPDIDIEKIKATSDSDIRRHQVEDGETPDAPLPGFRRTPNVRAIRTRLRMTQQGFADAIGVPVALVSV